MDLGHREPVCRRVSRFFLKFPLRTDQGRFTIFQGSCRDFQEILADGVPVLIGHHHAAIVGEGHDAR